MYRSSLKTLLITAAIIGLIISACGATAPTATPAIQEVVRTIVITTTPAPTPEPEFILIEPGKSQLGYITNADNVRFGTHGQYIRSDELVDVLMIHASRYIHYSTMGMDVCDGKVSGVDWDDASRKGWVKPGETAKIAMKAENANVGDHCQWVQWIQLSLLDNWRIRENYYLLLEVIVKD